MTKKLNRVKVLKKTATVEPV